ncbi:MAG: TrkA family potassium uptake protein [Candidatus Solibacter sp.]|nr:TrkA family potassium uptake protein [Candidatus Solibacter sp.]
MQRQALIIGLGQFGMSVAAALSERGVEVLAVDNREERVRASAAFAAESICLDATDTDALARTSPENRDFCVCAIGDEAREASIICTALLRQMGARRVIARANDDLHARILSLVGAHVIINPEREFGERFANQLVHENIRGEMDLGEGIRITEFEVPPGFEGQTLGQLQLPRRFGVTVVAVRHAGQKTISLPNPAADLAEGDILVVVSAQGAVARMMERS